MRSRGTIVLVTLPGCAPCWTTIARAWHRGDRLTRIVVRGGVHPRAVLEASRETVEGCPGPRLDNVRHLTLGDEQR